MHVKNLWAVSLILAKIKLFWDRITLTKTTTVYFLFSLLHCAIQVIFQVQAFQINVQAAGFLVSIVEQGDAIDSDAFYVFEKNDLRLCDSVPTPFDTSSCQVIWNGTVANNTLMPASTVEMDTADITAGPSSATTSTTSAKFSHSIMTTGIATKEPKSGNQDERIVSENTDVKRDFPGIVEAVEVNGTMQVVVNGLRLNDESANLSKECLWVLGWPIQVLRNTKREDLTFIMFQIWVLGMSIVAILNESVPHTIASLLTHLVVTGWAGFQIFNTAQFRNDFAEVTTSGASAEIPSLVLNAVALLLSTFLSWRLAKSFNWQTFKRVGASLAISRIYKIVLTLSIVIQLSLFFIITSIALWLDQLLHGAIGHLATSLAYRPLLIITLMLLPPWLASGWYSVRREQKIGMLIFLLMCLSYLASWGAMFDSTTFRWTYMTWTFFGVITTASVFLTLLSFILGIVCRFNFGKGLPYYLNARESADDFEPNMAGDPEKVGFPSSDEPTFSVAFGPGAQVPPLPQIPTAPGLAPTRTSLQKHPDDNRLVIE